MSVVLTATCILVIIQMGNRPVHLARNTPAYAVINLSVLVETSDALVNPASMRVGRALRHGDSNVSQSDRILIYFPMNPIIRFCNGVDIGYVCVLLVVERVGK